MLLRILLIVVVLYIAFALTAKARRLVKQSRVEKKSPGKMVKCADCGVYLPESEAHTRADGQFLCDTHDQDGPQDGPGQSGSGGSEQQQ